MASSFRNAIVNPLVQAKLYLRRVLRTRRRRLWTDPLTNSSEDPTTDQSTKRRHASQLPSPPSDKAPSFLPFAVFVFALLVRVYRLPYPASVVFDEVHFLRFVKGYYTGHYFFDIHPPLGKLILLVITRLFCGAPTLTYDSNGEEFGSQSYVPLRFTSAFFGALVAPLSFLICRELGLSLPSSVIPAVIQTFEHLAVVESRLVLIDAQLMSFMAAGLLFALRMWGAPRGRRWSLVIATSLTASAALSVKWTALATPCLIAIVSVTGYPFASSPLLFTEMIVAGFVAVAFYVSTFWLHFRLLPLSGRGDAFMPLRFQRTLIGGKHYVPGYSGPGFWRNFSYLNYKMFVANRGIKARHHWESRWWQWIINQRGLLYFNEAVADFQKLEKIYLIVNPGVTLITLVALIAFMCILGTWAVKRIRRRGKQAISRRMQSIVERGSFLLAGFVFNLLPFTEVARCTFLYHYLPALFYAILETACVVDGIQSATAKRGVSAFACMIVLVCFFVWSPWMYATALPAETHDWRRLYGKGWQ